MDCSDSDNDNYSNSSKYCNPLQSIIHNYDTICTLSGKALRIMSTHLVNFSVVSLVLYRSCIFIFIFILYHIHLLQFFCKCSSKQPLLKSFTLKLRWKLLTCNLQKLSINRHFFLDNFLYSRSFFHPYPYVISSL